MISAQVTSDAQRVLVRLKGAARRVPEAAARALNRVAAQARTEVSRKVKESHGYSSRTVLRHILVGRATPTSLEAVLHVSGGPWPLYALSPSPRTRPRRRSKGVTVTIKGRRVKFRSAFVARMKSGHIGVFARGKYTRGQPGFAFGGKRLPINELFGPPAPHIVQSKVVLAAIEASIRDNLERRIEYEIGRLGLS